MPDGERCPTCHGELIQKNRWKLFLVALALLAVSAACFRISHGLRLAVIPLGLIGCYLVAWSSIGRGRWCRQCKRFPVG